MKTIIAILSLLPSLASANLCREVSPLKTEFERQADWKSVSVSAIKTNKPILGYLDPSGDLFVGDLTGQHQVEAEFQMLPKKADPRFEQACTSFFVGDRYLRLNRELAKGHTYTISGRFLPKIAEAKNDPYAPIQTNSLDVRVEYSSDALVNADISAKDLKAKIQREITDQLNASLTSHSFRIDLTNLDDFACDIVRGRAKISVYRRMAGDDPLVSRNVLISPRDVSTLYADWANATKKTRSREEAFFVAGQSFEALQRRGLTQNVKTSDVIELAHKVIPENSSTVSFLRDQELQCLADTMQEFTRNRIQHRVNTEISINEEQALSGEEQ